MIYKTLHRRTDNTMAKRKRTNNDLQNITQKDTIHWPKVKGQTMIYKTLHRRTDNTLAKRKRTNNHLQNTTQKNKN
jgi:hypothetical protein